MYQRTTSKDPGVVAKLASLTHQEGAFDLANTLALLNGFAADNLRDLEHELHIEREDIVGQSASHLTRLGGKRLRPLCVALAARFGDPNFDYVKKLAAAAEFVHSATLLHDDVVDLGDVRRGQPTSRLIYGNAASVFAGDWLLVEALRRVRHTKLLDVLDRLLVTLDDMIVAEAIQLERRKKIIADRATYMAIVEGKTASLFSWAMFAGGRVAGLNAEACEQLALFGKNLGIGFQIIDDVLDISGESIQTGKALFTDLREGKMTFPVILGLELDPDLEVLLNKIVEEESTDGTALQVLERLKDLGAVKMAHQAAQQFAEAAFENLNYLPDGEAKVALQVVVMAAIQRNR